MEQYTAQPGGWLTIVDEPTRPGPGVEIGLGHGVTVPEALHTAAEFAVLTTETVTVKTADIWRAWTFRIDGTRTAEATSDDIADGLSNLYYSNLHLSDTPIHFSWPPEV